MQTTMVGFGLGNFLIGKITDKIGIKIPIVIAIITLILSYLLATISKEFWQLLILQVFMGLAAATFFGPSMADIGNFFETRRGLAVSIIASANYVAGASWPLVISYFLNFSDWRDVYLIALHYMSNNYGASVLILKNNIVHIGYYFKFKLFKIMKFNNLSSKNLQFLLMVAGVGCCVAMAMPQVHIVALCVDSGFGLNVGS